MSTSSIVETRGTSRGSGVDPDTLVCAGCAEPVECAPRIHCSGELGPVPEFSHRDGSELCPDGDGVPGEPVEVGTTLWGPVC